MTNLTKWNALSLRKKAPEAVIDALVERAMEAGGRDNITAVCVCATGIEDRVRNLDGFLKRFFG